MFSFVLDRPVSLVIRVRFGQSWNRFCLGHHIQIGSEVCLHSYWVGSYPVGKAGVFKYRAPGCFGPTLLYLGVRYLWILSVALTSFQQSGD